MTFPIISDDLEFNVDLPSLPSLLSLKKLRLQLGVNHLQVREAKQ